MLGIARVQPSLDYSISSCFFSMPQGFKRKLQVAQNKLVHFILNTNPRHHVSPDELQKVGLLDVKHRAIQLRLTHGYNIFYKLGPSYMQENFERVNEHHAYNTRNSAWNFTVPRVRNNFELNTFFINTIKNRLIYMYKHEYNFDLHVLSYRVFIIVMLSVIGIYILI